MRPSDRKPNWSLLILLLSTSQATQSTTFSTSPLSLRSPKMLPLLVKKYV